MVNIEVDFDVFKEITKRRSSEDVSCNDVIRELLALGPMVSRAFLATSTASEGGWISKGVCYPEGTEFRANHKGQVYYGKVVSGALVVNGKSFNSPSAAAISITGYQTNGRKFWEYRISGTEVWQKINPSRK